LTLVASVGALTAPQPRATVSGERTPLRAVRRDGQGGYGCCV